MNKDTSGPAFPVFAADDEVKLGLTKREWFAGMALNGMVARPGYSEDRANCAVDAVAWADALLAELNKEKS